MGRGSSGAGGGGSVDIPSSGGGGADGLDIKGTRDMIAERGRYQEVTDGMLTVSRDMIDEYGGADIYQFQIAEIGGASSTIAYYDGNNIAFNQKYMNAKSLDSAYDACVKAGFHPSRGNKTGAQAVASHEYGHALADAVGKKTGVGIDQASTNIVTKAMARTKHKKASSFAKAISGYAKTNTAETVAEAVSDVYCNGRKAKTESKAIVRVIKNKLKEG